MAGSIEVTDNPEASRYEIRRDGELAGFVDYRLKEDVISFTHTEIDAAYGGQGLGGALVKAALDGARQAGLQVAPSCPFVARYILRHEEYLPLVPEEHRPLLERAR